MRWYCGRRCAEQIWDVSTLLRKSTNAGDSTLILHVAGQVAIVIDRSAGGLGFATCSTCCSCT
jgi:hypothetical protein